MTSANLDSTDLRSVDFEGLIKEEVMDRIWDISNIPLPYMDLVGSDTTDNEYCSWVTDKLADPELGGWVVDGADSDQDDSATGARIGNHCGILKKEIRVSTRAQHSGTIGHDNELSYQVEMRQKELRRNVEANLLGIQGSQESDANSDVPGIAAGLAAMITQFDTGSGATGGGFAAGIFTGITPGTRTPLTETLVRDAAQAAWEDGADPSVMMSIPSVIRAFSEYLFTSSARIATLTAETNQNGPATGMGSVNEFLTDFGVTLRMVPNRIQRPYKDTSGTDDAAAVYILDPAYARVTYLHGYRVDPLNKTGLSDKRMMSVDFTQKALEPNAHRVLLDINPAAAVTQA